MPFSAYQCTLQVFYELERQDGDLELVLKSCRQGAEVRQPLRLVGRCQLGVLALRLQVDAAGRT